MGTVVWIAFISVYSALLYTLYRVRSSRNRLGRNDTGDNDQGEGGEPLPDKDPILDLPPGIGLSSDIDETKLHSISLQKHCTQT